MSRSSVPRRCHRTVALASVLTLAMACQDESTPTGPYLARGGNAAPLTATPTALTFLLPDVTPANVTTRVQFVGTITATTSDPQCATVSPLSAPATKPPGSPMYVATFTVTPVGGGLCTVTFTDKKGGRAQVRVAVEAALTERMVFVSTRAPNGELFVREANGTVTQLTEDWEWFGGGPAVAPNGRIVFTTSVPDHNIEIYIMDADGSNKTRLTFDEPHGPQDNSPTVSPDGQVIAFSSRRDGNSEIYVMGIDGSNPVNLTQDPGEDFSPKFSSDGAKIVFGSYRDGNSDIYIMDADGTNLIRLTTESADDVSPVFAPDGGIVFGSDRSGNRELYHMDADGSNVSRLTEDPATELGPAFTRDGRLAFASNRDGDFDIYLKGTTGVLIPLTDHEAADGSPAF